MWKGEGKQSSWTKEATISPLSAIPFFTSEVPGRSECCRRTKPLRIDWEMFLCFKKEKLGENLEVLSLLYKWSLTFQGFIGCFFVPIHESAPSHCEVLEGPKEFRPEPVERMKARLDRRMGSWVHQEVFHRFSSFFSMFGGGFFIVFHRFFHVHIFSFSFSLFFWWLFQVQLAGGFKSFSTSQGRALSDGAIGWVTATTKRPTKSLSIWNPSENAGEWTSPKHLVVGQFDWNWPLWPFGHSSHLAPSVARLKRWYPAYICKQNTALSLVGWY